MPKGVIQSYPFYCDHLGALKRDNEDIATHFHKVTLSSLRGTTM
jgi:hypothetical protein